MEDYEELAAVVAEREAKRARREETAPEPISPPDEADGGDAGSAGGGGGTVYAPMFTVREAAVAALARLLVTWEDEDLEKLAGDSRPAAQAWAHALDVCSQRPGAAVPTSQLVEAAPSKVAGLYAGTDSLDRLLVRHYGGLGRPARLIGGAQLGHHDDQRYWVVTREQAAAWGRARAKTEPTVP